MTEDFLCTLCPRSCNKLRTAQSGAGFCACPSLARVARAAAHFGEEPCISGTKGSGTVFFTGCPLRCVFCQNSEISREPMKGKALDAKELRAVFDSLAETGVHNLNLVSPTQYANVIARALEAPFPLPVVWNTSGYESLETLKALEGKVQIYLCDMKYADNTLARRFSSAEGYFETASTAAREMFRQVGEASFDGEGMMTSGLIIRHLALPSHLNNSRAVIDWFCESFPKCAALFSLMTQYTPKNELSAFPELQRRLSRRECRLLEEYLCEAGIEAGYAQSRSSASGDFIPKFDLTGL